MLLCLCNSFGSSFGAQTRRACILHSPYETFRQLGRPASVYITSKIESLLWEHHKGTPNIVKVRVMRYLLKLSGPLPSPTFAMPMGDLELSVDSLASAPASTCDRQAPPSRPRQTVAKKHLKGRRASDVTFPPFSELEDLCGDLPSSRFDWAKGFVQRAQTAFGTERFALRDQTVRFFSEFSGSGCAEAALMSVANALGHKGGVKTAYCADFDAQCRNVLSKSCRDPSSMNDVGQWHHELVLF